jgi:hypothetical protein
MTENDEFIAYNHVWIEEAKKWLKFMNLM